MCTICDDEQTPESEILSAITAAYLQDLTEVEAWEIARKAMADMRAEIERLRKALRDIAESPHCTYSVHEPESAADGQYRIGVADGHRCAAEMARRALSSTKTFQKEQQ